MLLTINQNNNQLINGLNFPEAIQDNLIQIKRGDTASLAFIFGQPFLPAVEIDAASPITSFKFGAKVVGNYDAPYVVSNWNGSSFGFFKTGTGASAVYTTNPSWNTAALNNLLGYDPYGFAQVTNVWTLADIAGSLAGKYVDVPDYAGPVRFWFKVGGAGAAPAVPSSGRLIEVDIATNATANAVATALAAAAAGDAQFTASTAASDLVQFVDSVVGLRATSPAVGTSGFSIAIWIAGSAPNTLADVEYVDLMAELEWVINGVITSTVPFTVRVFNDVNKGTEGGVTSPNPATYPIWQPVLNGSGIQVVPATDADFSMFPGGVAPVSGFYQVAEPTKLWIFIPGWTAWRYSILTRSA